MVIEGPENNSTASLYMFEGGVLISRWYPNGEFSPPEMGPTD